MVCSRVVISGVVGGSGNPSWNTKGLVIFRGHKQFERILRPLTKVPNELM